MKAKNYGYVLGREEVYKATDKVWPCRKVNDIVEGIELRLSNMAGGYPFKFAGKQWASSEQLYLCGEFSNENEHHISIQQEIYNAKSGYAAKRFVKSKYKNYVRSDFEGEFRLQWMLFVVWMKCLENEDFREKLLSLPDDVIIVEDTTTDINSTASIWGCENKELRNIRKLKEKEIMSRSEHMTKKKLEELVNVETNDIRSHGKWIGQNNMGKILMICRQCIRDGSQPDIDYELLRGKRIHIFGELLTFEESTTPLFREG